MCAGESVGTGVGGREGDGRGGRRRGTEEGGNGRREEGKRGEKRTLEDVDVGDEVEGERVGKDLVVRYFLLAACHLSERGRARRSV